MPDKIHAIFSLQSSSKSCVLQMFIVHLESSSAELAKKQQMVGIGRMKSTSCIFMDNLDPSMKSTDLHPVSELAKAPAYTFQWSSLPYQEIRLSIPAYAGTVSDTVPTSAPAPSTVRHMRLRVSSPRLDWVCTRKFPSSFETISHQNVLGYSKISWEHPPCGCNSRC